ncbi:uncharacterized protein RJT21DRAFT_116406 [Scheffersomyces amazonensis]|uniref:uncharacterized protein n=1 Tax=Scheffersomyces amazonensis TaxID=1078765 RepID=UPI00315CFF1C
MFIQSPLKYVDISKDVYEWANKQKRLYYFPHLFENYLSKSYFEHNDLLQIYLKFTPYTTIHPGKLTIQSCMELCDERVGSTFDVYMDVHRWADFNDSPPLSNYQKLCRTVQIYQIKKKEEILKDDATDYPDEIIKLREQLITSILVVHHCPHFKLEYQRDYYKIMRYIQDLIQFLNDERIYFKKYNKLSKDDIPEIPLEMIEWYDCFLHCDFNKIYEFEPPIFQIKVTEFAGSKTDQLQKTNNAFCSHLQSPSTYSNFVPTNPSTSESTVLEKFSDFWKYAYDYYNIKAICGEYRFLKLFKDGHKSCGKGDIKYKWPRHILNLENQLEYEKERYHNEFYDLNSEEMADRLMYLEDLKRTIEIEKHKFPQARLTSLAEPMNDLPTILVNKLAFFKNNQAPSPKQIIKSSILKKFNELKLEVGKELPNESNFEPYQVRDTADKDLIILNDNDKETFESLTTENISSLLELYHQNENNKSTERKPSSTSTNVTSISANKQASIFSRNTTDESEQESTENISISATAIRAIAREVNYNDIFKGRDYKYQYVPLENSPWSREE